MSDYTELLADLDMWAKVQPKAAEAIRELEARLAAAEADAERYRWLRDQCVSGPLTIAKATEWSLEGWSGDNHDAAIDAARSAK